MSPQRNADAANVSPYPFVVHQVPSTPQELPDRSARPSKAKKRLRQRQERSDARQGVEEERRFNVGPRRTTTHASRRGLLPPPPRSLPNGVPDYPPPSFEETVNRPSMSVCSSTTSLVSVLPTPPLSIPEDIPEDLQEAKPTVYVESSQRRRVEIDPVSEASASDNASESDESALVIINKNEIPVSSNDLPRGRDLEAKIKKDWLKRRGVDFPTASSSDPPKVNNTLPRGRKPARPTLLIDPAVANSPYMSPTSPLSSPKRRFLSLSPIRTIFPAKNAIQEDKAHSAHPSPISTPPSSPYTGSKSFFRSTTSLATVSLLRLPGVSSSQSQSTKGSLSRRLFSFKGKAKEIVVDSADDAWEVVPTNAGEDDSKKEEHPASLLAMVESSMNGSVVTLAKNSPTRSTFSVQSSPNRLQSTLTSPSVVSLREKTPVTPFLERSVNRRSMNISPTIPEAPETPTATSQTPTKATPSTPPRTPTNITETIPSPAPSPKHLTRPPPPLRMETRPNHRQPMAEPLEDEKALETPLPMTPVYQACFENNTTTVNALNEQNRTPVPIHAQERASQSVTDFFDLPESRTAPPTELGCACGGTPHSKDRAPAHHGAPPHPGALVFPYHPSGLPTQTQVSLLMRPSINDEPMTPTKQQPPSHYNARPLPRPPPGSGPNTPPPASVTFNRSRAAVDSIYSSLSVTDRSSPTDSNPACPEGHLIDLEDTTLDSCISPTFTEATAGSSYDYPDARAYNRRYEPDVHTLSSGLSSSNNSIRERSALLTSVHPDLSFGSSSIQASSTPPGAYGRPPLPPIHQQVKSLLPSTELLPRQQHHLQQQQILRTQQQRHLQTLHQSQWTMTREYSQVTDPSDIYGSEVGHDRDESVVEEEDDEEVVYYPQSHRRRRSSPLHESASSSSHSYHYPTQRRPSHDFSPSRDNTTWTRDPVGLSPNSRGGYGGSSVSLATSPSSREVEMPLGSGSTYTLPLQQSQYVGHSLDSSHRQRQNAAPWAY